MATQADFKELTAGLGVDSDCPVCGFSFPGCQGLCVAHTSANGHPGPFHTDYNDDCEECTKPRKLPPYEPRPEDMAWARTIINILKDGGYVGTSVATYRIDKANKKFILTEPVDPWTTPMTALMHHRHHCVFAKFGWTVEPVVDWSKLELPPLRPS